MRLDDFSLVRMAVVSASTGITVENQAVAFMNSCKLAGVSNGGEWLTEVQNLTFRELFARYMDDAPAVVSLIFSANAPTLRYRIVT